MLYIYRLDLNTIAMFTSFVGKYSIKLELTCDRLCSFIRSRVRSFVRSILFVTAITAMCYCHNLHAIV